MKESVYIQQLKSLKIMLVADTCHDIYQYGKVERISPEAPVPIFLPTETKILGGMGFNVQKNLTNLGVSVAHYLGTPSKKTRLVDQKTNAQILRIDEDEERSPLGMDTVYCSLNAIDAIVVSDYEKGFLTYNFIEDLIRISDVPVFIDTKKRDLKRFEGGILKINNTEYSNRISDHPEAIITRGSDSVRYRGKEYKVPNKKIFDVCGAGDTFLAVLSAFSIITNIDHAIHMAIKAATITVQHCGVYAPTIKEILHE